MLISTTLCRSLLLTAFAVVLFAGGALSQPASIRTGEGFLFILNGKDISYSCEVNAKEIKAITTAGNPAFVADGFLIQMLDVKGSNFDASGKVELGKLLQMHRDWEVDYLKTVFGTELAPASELVKLESREVLFWSFQRPKYVVEYDRDAYATTLMGRDVFGINTPVKIGEDLNTAKERIFKVMRTLRTSKKPYNVSEIAEAIRKGEKPKL